MVVNPTGTAGPALADSWFQVLNFFGLFWLLFFVEALGEMVLAGAFAGWYWCSDKALLVKSSQTD